MASDLWAAKSALEGAPDPHEITAIDLTASVGGMTLALAKASFAQVIAVEIDPTRATLCQQNMVQHGREDIVQVYHSDAMDLLPQMAGLCQFPHCVVVIDPPWGGIHYKQRKPPLCMGPWKLEQVVERVVECLAPTVLGLRLPLYVVVSDFLERLQGGRNDIHLETLSIRKLGAQLYVVLSCQKDSQQGKGQLSTESELQ